MGLRISAYILNESTVMKCGALVQVLALNWRNELGAAARASYSQDAPDAVQQQERQKHKDGMLHHTLKRYISLHT